MDNEKFSEMVRRHKLGIARLVSTRKLTIGLQRTGEDLALAYAGCKCEKCGAEEKLQIHHLISFKVKEYMDLWKYLSQKIYWANLLVLCESCHRKLEGFSATKPEFMGSIPQKRLNYIKRKFSIELK